MYPVDTSLRLVAMILVVNVAKKPATFVPLTLTEVTVPRWTPLMTNVPPGELTGVKSLM